MNWRSKDIYFIRHGQSAQNISKIRQGASGKLSEKGREQAHFTGKRFEKIPLDIILVSPYERTKETASIINSHLHIPIEECPLLVERRNPSEIIGKDADSLEVKKIVDEIDRSYHDNNFRYSDEENFIDLKSRAHELLRFLENRREKRIMCVSHRIFLKMVASYIEDGEELSSQKFVKLDFLNQADNASVTFAQFSPLKKIFRGNFEGNCGWELLAWNDSSRLV